MIYVAPKQTTVISGNALNVSLNAFIVKQTGVFISPVKVEPSSFLFILRGNAYLRITNFFLIPFNLLSTQNIFLNLFLQRIK